MSPRLSRPLPSFAAKSGMAMLTALVVAGCSGPDHVTSPSLAGMAPDVTIERLFPVDQSHHAEGVFRNVDGSPKGDQTKPSGLEIATWIVTRRALPRLVGAQRHRFTATPAVHNSGRSLGAADRTLWAGWHMESRGGDDASPLSVFYAGDTAYGGHLADVRSRLGVPDLAIVPIGAYEPQRFTGAFHVNPEEAISAFLDLGGGAASASRRVPVLVPVHWGTFELTDEPMAEPPLRLAVAARNAGITGRIELLPIGGRLEIPFDASRSRDQVDTVY